MLLIVRPLYPKWIESLREFSALFILLIFLLISAFTPLNQDTLPNVSALNRKNEFVSEITDRDRVQI